MAKNGLKHGKNYHSELGGWTSAQYLDFLTEEALYLDEWLSNYRMAYNSKRTMDEPSDEFKRLAKSYKIIKSEIKGFFPYGD
jgi:hypothetical protein